MSKEHKLPVQAKMERHNPFYVNQPTELRNEISVWDFSFIKNNLIPVSGYVEKQAILAGDFTCGDHYCSGGWIDFFLCIWEKGFISSQFSRVTLLLRSRRCTFT